MNLWVVLTSSIILSGMLCYFLIPTAWRLGLIDNPCQRKQHLGQVPLIGGLSVFFTTIIVFGFAFNLDLHLRLFILASSLMVAIGVLDDKFDLSVRLRIVAQLTVSGIIVFGADTYIRHLGNVFGLGNVELGWFGVPFTLLAIMAAINAYNMIDGIDGLLGSMGIVSFSGIAVLAGGNGQTFAVAAATTIIGALLPFWARNTGIPFKKARKIFMGDAGSMFIGLSVVWLLALIIDPAQFNDSGNAVRPVAVLWLIAIPLMDMLAIMVRRVLKGQSPFRPDRDHLHHIFMRAGFSPREALICITAKAVILALFGIALEVWKVPESVVLLLYTIVFISYCLVLKFAWRFVSWVRTMRGIE
ncbi:undecaprenyl-phosphate alpha-N-acetylglucosaminyl 1-phosphate transferase [Idiomarina tyrosinivorans]|uniref:Undecaprenyl-phosphate alpha-N-acetylglucosaminyl 1-phosphate transferase n=1 Tax=Idiomarina tyrosinivorans TaxID=1445662 RepID=A0A432ZQZ6_9GAMM|nr:UDP-N-acetylglucosamine--undecaprenyl-phosphate N-acetylglucosaminephosphotransferase [Idiomarina tyrosinivorans]RUO80258.1 undecaprenyl-phosphate alpha-N-acetylglucosaminyl 1-phosphate transferase [Idiomarina tyrosinivorans]